MTRFEDLQAKRREVHLAAAQAAWFGLREELEVLGIEYRIFGSFSSGEFLEHSDIDLMIMGDLPAETRQHVRRTIGAKQKETGIEIDFQFAQDLTEETCEALLEY